MNPIAEHSRRINNLNNLATVIEVDAEKGLCRVEIAENQTDWIPFRSGRSGASQIWLPPSVGEQVELISMGGELSTAYVGGSLPSDEHPVPSHPTHPQMTLPDGASFRYDIDEHQLLITLPSGGKALLDADLGVSGTVIANDFVTADGVSLNRHFHGGVKPGPAVTTAPVAAPTGNSSDVTNDEFSGEMLAWYLLARG
jgi:phage baseplate assembly protein gpV